MGLSCVERKYAIQQSASCDVYLAGPLALALESDKWNFYLV